MARLNRDRHLPVPLARYATLTSLVDRQRPGKAAPMGIRSGPRYQRSTEAARFTPWGLLCVVGSALPVISLVSTQV